MIAEESFIDFNCPYCGGSVSFPRDCAGLARECPNCIESVIVPEDGNGTGRKLPLPVTTPRLVLRRLAAADWQDLQELLSDEEIFRYAEGRPLEEEEILRWLESDAHVRLTSPGQAFYLGIQLKDGGKLIGYLRLSLREPERLQAAVTVFLNRRFQRQGFALEAVNALLGFCFEGVKMHRVTAGCDSKNSAACRLFENVGLRREGEFLKDNFFNGEWTNTVWYAVLSDEYLKADSPGKATTG